jgi:hypothetical protein
MNKIEINITSGGFFAQCRGVLISLIEHINNHKCFPKIMPNQNIFDKYNPFVDVYNPMTLFFKPSDKPYKLNQQSEFLIPGHPSQNFNDIQQIINHYFSPNDEIIKNKKFIIDKYKLKNSLSNFCAVYYRGTDKHKEAGYIDFSVFEKKVTEIANSNSNIKFILQTDDQLFHNHMVHFFKKKSYKYITFEENKLIADNTKGFHLTQAAGETQSKHSNNPWGIGFKTKLKNFEHIKLLLAIFLILSECKYLICSESCGSWWMEIVRNNCKNFYLYQNMSWLTSS